MREYIALLFQIWKFWLQLFCLFDLHLRVPYCYSGCQKRIWWYTRTSESMMKWLSNLMRTRIQWHSILKYGIDVINLFRSSCLFPSVDSPPFRHCTRTSVFFSPVSFRFLSIPTIGFRKFFIFPVDCFI